MSYKSQEQTINRKKDYKIIRISKGNGQSRKIYCVSQAQRDQYRLHLPYLETKLKELDNDNVNYAFTKGKNCTLNALQHVGFKFTLSFDLKNFFETINPLHLSGLINKKIIEECFIDGAPQQGLPTSPLISNIAFLKCDKQINNALNNLKIKHVYTRYADDITISFDEKNDVGKIKFIVKNIITENKFILNPDKTKLQNSANGRIIITGIAVDKDGIYPTRKTKRKIRAAAHQNNVSSARGLFEWSKCKLPKKVLEHG